MSVNEFPSAYFRDSSDNLSSGTKKILPSENLLIFAPRSFARSITSISVPLKVLPFLSVNTLAPNRLRVEHNMSGMTSRADLTAFEVLMQKSNPSSANTQIHAKKLHA